jgi:hypothetical protein
MAGCVSLLLSLDRSLKGRQGWGEEGGKEGRKEERIEIYGQGNRGCEKEEKNEKQEKKKEKTEKRDGPVCYFTQYTL